MILLYSVRDRLKKKYMPSQIMGVSRPFSLLECVDRYESIAMLSECDVERGEGGKNRRKRQIKLKTMWTQIYI